MNNDELTTTLVAPFEGAADLQTVLVPAEVGEKKPLNIPLDMPNATGVAAGLMKVCCRSCSYTMRVTQKWIDKAIPKCPSPDRELCGKEMEVA